MSNEEIVDHPGFRVTVADSIGSGDAFTAALVTGLLQGRDLVTTNRAANRLGAYVASHSGATPDMATDVLSGLWDQS